MLLVGIEWPVWNLVPDKRSSPARRSDMVSRSLKVSHHDDEKMKEKEMSQISLSSLVRQGRTSLVTDTEDVKLTVLISSSLFYWWGSWAGSVVTLFDSESMCFRFESHSQNWTLRLSLSAPWLGNQRPWYVQLCLCDWAYKISRATYRKEKRIVSRWSVSS